MGISYSKKKSTIAIDQSVTSSDFESNKVYDSLDSEKPKTPRSSTLLSKNHHANSLSPRRFSIPNSYIRSSPNGKSVSSESTNFPTITTSTSEDFSSSSTGLSTPLRLSIPIPKSSSTSASPRKQSHENIKIPRSKTLDEFITSPRSYFGDNLTLTPRNNMVIVNHNITAQNSKHINDRNQACFESYDHNTHIEKYFMCNLCSRKFPTENEYNNHCQFSKVHHITLQKFRNGNTISKSRLDISDALDRLSLSGSLDSSQEDYSFISKNSETD